MDFVTLLAGVSASQPSGPFDAGTAQSSCTLRVAVAGSPSFSVQLQGSADAATWTNVGGAVTGAGDSSLTPSPAARYFRAVLSGYTGPGSVSALLGYAAGAGYTSDGITGETMRAESAESLATLKSANLADVADAGSARANLHVPALTPAACVVTANVAALTGLGTYDGYTLAAGDQILLAGQTAASQNGVWAAASGAWTRPTDFTAGMVVKGRSCTVLNGTAYAGTTWILQAPTAGVTVDTSSQAWLNSAYTGKSSAAATLTDASPVAVNAALGGYLRLTLTSAIGATRMLQNPTGAADGMAFDLEVIQPASGGPCALTFDTNYAFSASLPSVTLSTSANATDFTRFRYNSTAGKWRVLAVNTGF